MKKYSNKDYVRKLNDGDLEFLHNRLTDKLSGDISAAVDVLQRNHEIDIWLRSAKNADEFFNCIDQVEEMVVEEIKKRHPDKIKNF